MVDQIIWITKYIILIEATTHAIRSWEILDTWRKYLTSKSNFLDRLLTCYECTAIWTSAGAYLYIEYLDFAPLTYILVFQRLSCYLHSAWELLEAHRAVKQNQI